MLRHPPRLTRTYPLFPAPSLFRSDGGQDYSLHSASSFVAAAGAASSLGTASTPSAPAICTARERMLSGTVSSLTIAAKIGAAASGLFCFRWARATISPRSEEHASELQSLMRISYAVFCLKKN